MKRFTLVFSRPGLCHSCLPALSMRRQRRVVVRYRAALGPEDDPGGGIKRLQEELLPGLFVVVDVEFGPASLSLMPTAMIRTEEER